MSCPRKEIDLTIPAPAGFDPSAQILVGHVINFRGLDELTLVDTASAAIDLLGQMLLTTNSPPHEGPRKSGYYDMATSDRGVGYTIGVVDKEHSTGDIIASPLFYVFPFLEPELTKFVMPVLADQPAVVSLVGLDGTVKDTVSIIGPPRGQYVQIPGLTDSDTPAEVSQISIPEAETEVPTDEKLIIDLSRRVGANADGSLPAGAIEVRDQTGQLIEGIWAVVSADFKRVQFFPERPLPPGTPLTVQVQALFDIAGRPFLPFSSHFTTFQPALVASIPMDANDVDVLYLLQGLDTWPYAIVARNGDEQTDGQGGLLTVDIADPFKPKIFLNEALTPGIDRAVRVVSHAPPRVVSINGAGNPQRFGELRVHDFSAPAAPVMVGRRVLNLSPQAIQAQIFLADIPPEGGVPRSIALLGTNTAYVANPPTIGLQQATLSGLTPPHNAVEGIFKGTYRAVEVVGQFVVAVGQKGGQNEILVLSNDLGQVLSSRPLAAAPLEIIAAPKYPVDLDGDGNLGNAETVDGDATTAADEEMDLVIVPCAASALCVYQVAPTGSLVELSILSLPTGLGSPRGGVVDPQLRVVYLAAGTAGLVLLDLDDPFQPPSGGALLTTVPLPGLSRRVRRATYAGGGEFVLVASSEGLHIVEVARPSVQFVSARETDNEVNAIINRVAKYDPPDDPPTSFGAPINRLYMVARQGDGNFHALLDLTSATVPREQVLWGIYNAQGDKIAQGRMPILGPAAVDFAPADPNEDQQYDLRFGIDGDTVLELGYGQLEIHELVPSPDGPQMRVIPDSSYATARNEIASAARLGTLSTPPLGIFGVPVVPPLPVAYPITGALLRIFLDGGLPQNAPGSGLLLPRAEPSAPQPFHHATDAFSNWLTHSAGADFSASTGEAPISNYVWDFHSTAGQAIAGRVATSQVIEDDLCAILNDHRAEIIAHVGPLGGLRRTSFTPEELVDCLVPQIPGTEPCNLENIEPQQAYRVVKYPFFDPRSPTNLVFNNTATDLGGAFGRVRLRQEISVIVDGGTVILIESRGRIDDLFDFNYESRPESYQSSELPRHAARVQLGYSSRRPTGQIFKIATDFSFVWNSNPCAGW